MVLGRRSLFCGYRAYQAHEVINADGVALRAVAGRITRSASEFWVASLRAGAVNILPFTVHIAESPSESYIVGVRRTGAVLGAAPEVWVIRLARLMF